jgi:hypothetical protein
MTQSPFYGPRDSQVIGKRRCNLVLVANRFVNHEADFHKIANYIREIDPKITPVVIGNRKQDLAQLPALLLHPTLGFSPVGLSKFCLLRGKMMNGQNFSKSQEYEYLEAAGFPVPQWRIIGEDEAPDLSDFSPYVVTKPNRGMRGAMVRIRRKGRIKAHKVDNDKSGKDTVITPEGRKTNVGYHLKEDAQMLAQEFVYTGLWPISYRVTTLFGQVIHSFKVEASHERTELPGPDAFGKLPEDKGVSIVASSQGCTMSLNYDEEIIRLGEAAHAAFPDIPLLGIDIVREVPSGKLYILEVNANGYVWHFSSPMGKKFQSDFNFNLESQFDGLRKAAHILAEKTQELAR